MKNLVKLMFAAACAAAPLLVATPAHAQWYVHSIFVYQDNNDPTGTFQFDDSAYGVGNTPTLTVSPSTASIKTAATGGTGRGSPIGVGRRQIRGANLVAG